MEKMIQIAESHGWVVNMDSDSIEFNQSKMCIRDRYIVLHGTEYTVFPKGEAKDGAYWRD